MSVRVVARIRPLLKAEIARDVIVDAAAADSSDRKTIVRIPNPRKESEAFSFVFNSVYEQDTTQAQLFDSEVSPSIKQLFKGYDVTIFAYGVTGTGKTHTMRGGKSLADRGVIPRLLSTIYRKARKIEKDGAGETQVEVAMSYYEIYNDRVYDLFEPPEKRTPAGLPIRDVGNGKTQVVGLTERPCTTLKEFEQLYDQANVNRSTSATKLNAHSSRSHAILCVKITQTTGLETRVSTASAIDLAGSEDNRRTDNNKERLVESASINKSLFVLAQCVDAIGKKQARIPYRESKMTRILSLGQNDGLTVMILNLAPVRSYHLDTLSSLNLANRTKKIEVNEVENQPFFREPQGKSKLDGATSGFLNAPSVHRQPLRPKLLSQIGQLGETMNVPKPMKQFAVYSDKVKTTQRPSHSTISTQARSAEASLKSLKRTSSEAMPNFARPSKMLKPNDPVRTAKIDPGMTKDAIEALIERKVHEALTERADRETTASSGDPISDEVQRRLDALEKRVEGKETERSEGLQYLLMAKQHEVRGEAASALKMYRLAAPHFPGNAKLARKMLACRERIGAKRGEPVASLPCAAQVGEEVEVPSDARTSAKPPARRRKQPHAAAGGDDDDSYHEADDSEQACEQEEDDDDEEEYNAAEYPVRPHTKLRRAQTARPPGSNATAPPSRPSPDENCSSSSTAIGDDASDRGPHTPRTRHLLRIINSRDVRRIQQLRGVGAKKAEAIVSALCELEDEDDDEDGDEDDGDGDGARVTSLGQLGRMKGVGAKTVESMRVGVLA